MDPAASTERVAAASVEQVAAGWPSWGWRFESFVYARHNNSPAIRAALDRVLASLGDDGVGLNLGSGWTSLHPRLLNLDVTRNSSLDLTGDAHALPFTDGSLRCVVSQEVFEHLTRPWVAIQEVARVLSPGGRAYIQVPMIIGLHSAPHDYYRFTPHGLRTLVESAGLRAAEIAPAVGAGTAAYRVFVDFWGTLAGSATQRAYRPAKALAAVVGAPLRWLDRLTMRQDDTNRIAAGYFVIAEKMAPV
jgi:SAM-dependent methyltransferase